MKPLIRFEKKQVISINLSLGGYLSFIENIINLGSKHCSSYVCVANTHMLIEAYDDLTFAKVVNNADIVTPDGMPLVIGAKLIYGIDQERVAGMDLLPDLLKAAEEKKLNVFFFGGTKFLQDSVASYVKKSLPFLRVAGYISPPFRHFTDAEMAAYSEIINRSNAHLVVVSLGCPKQEKWMASMKGKISACMIGLGGALPVMAGIQKRAPKWMQKMSLEWLFRLMQEPNRLFKRYVYTNSKYIALLFRELLKQKLKA